MSLWRTLQGGVAARQQVRPLAPSDAQAIQGLLRESPEAAQWSPTAFLRGLAEGNCAWVAEEGGEVIGMVAARAAAGEAEILNLAVLPRHRRRGLARSLVECAIARARAAGAASVFLEVRETNSAARALYATLGFVAAGRRRDYYRDPVEDAIVLSLPL